MKEEYEKLYQNVLVALRERYERVHAIESFQDNPAVTFELDRVYEAELETLHAIEEKLKVRKQVALVGHKL
ncbi:MAG: hypothetical protein WBC04_08635 [Candidatus Acidiferrales bacterium]